MSIPELKTLMQDDRELNEHYVLLMQPIWLLSAAYCSAVLFTVQQSGNPLFRST
jgi:hypothetical protein